VSRLFGRRNRRRGREEREGIARAILRGVVCVLAVAAGVVGYPYARGWVSAHPYFAIQEIVVRGTRRLTPEEVRRGAGIVPGTSIWHVDGAVAAHRLEESPWVRSALVTRMLPCRVVIAVREERPMAILVASRGGDSPILFYVAARGRIFAAAGPGDPRDLPYLTGLEAGDLGGDQAFGPRAIRRALGLMRLAARTAPVSEIHVDRRRGLTLMPMRPAVPIEVGWGRFEDRLARLPDVMARWSGREGEIVGVSLAFDDEVIVRTRPTPKSAPFRRPART
jgi:hypothetical protein